MEGKSVPQLTKEERLRIGHEELQDNPIFLLQVADVIVTNSNLEWNSDLQCIIDPITGAELDDDKLMENDWAVKRWRTESVWLTREEAEAWGKRTSYHYGKGRYGIDWMVFCVSAMGDLVDVLNGDLNHRDALQVECAPSSKTDKVDQVTIRTE
jgi:hypothetical protein